MAVAGRAGCGHAAGEEGHRVGMHRCTAMRRAVPPYCRGPHRRTLQQHCAAAWPHTASPHTARRRPHRRTLHAAPLHTARLQRCTPQAACCMLHAARRTTALLHAAPRNGASPRPGSSAVQERNDFQILWHISPTPVSHRLDLQSRTLLLPATCWERERHRRASRLAGPCGHFTGPWQAPADRPVPGGTSLQQSCCRKTRFS